VKKTGRNGRKRKERGEEVEKIKTWASETKGNDCIQYPSGCCCRFSGLRTKEPRGQFTSPKGQ